MNHDDITEPHRRKRTDADLSTTSARANEGRYISGDVVPLAATPTTEEEREHHRKCNDIRSQLIRAANAWFKAATAGTVYGQLAATETIRRILYEVEP